MHKPPPKPRPRDYPREISETLQLVSASLEAIAGQLSQIKGILGKIEDNMGAPSSGDPQAVLDDGTADLKAANDAEQSALDRARE